MTERYDHRTPEARAADADEEAVLDQPLEPGASDLRAEAEQAVEQGRVEDDPSGPAEPSDPS
jgi:hypothetical protein